MTKRKPSLFERLTGAIKIDEFDDEEDRGDVYVDNSNDSDYQESLDNELAEESFEEGQLGIDMYETDKEIIIKAIVAGVRPDDLDISINREMVTVKGRREGEMSTETDNYFHQELYWGSFSRTILLPAEIEVEEAQAIEKHGLLIIRLPKVNKDRQTKLKVKSN